MSAQKGQGTHGTVYRVARAGDAEDRPFALKLARVPEDPRFVHEGELLSRLQHPGVPRLHDQGVWTGPDGRVFPYLVMEWVEGVPLYEWAQAHRPTSRQVLRLLAQVARALEAIDAASAVHRDVKGDNILVDGRGRAVLVDFGSGNRGGAGPLIQETLLPGTEPYRSPQALRFQWRFRRHRSARYPACAADDVYALGVTAYRLCTGRYPPQDPSMLEEEEQRLGEPLVLPGTLVMVCPELEALILRMLRDPPESRGTAVELARALETAAECAETEADEPILPRSSTSRPKSWRLQGLARTASWLSVAAVGAVMATAVWWWSASPPGSTPHADAEEVTPAGVADTALSGPSSASADMPEPGRASLSLDLPKKPLPGQRQPPCRRQEVEIRGGCWIELARVEPPCGDTYYEWQGACFSPVPAPQRPTTSDNP